MEKWFSISGTAIAAICLTAIGIHIAVIIYTRLAGKRSFSKMSSFDFAMTVAIGSVIATTVVSKSVSFLDGVVGLGAIYLVQMISAYLRRYRAYRHFSDNTPVVLMQGETIFEDNLKKCKVTKSDLRSKLREANVIELSQVKAVVFEATGDVSVLHGDGQLELQEWLMEDVKGYPE